MNLRDSSVIYTIFNRFRRSLVNIILENKLNSIINSPIISLKY